MVNGVDLAHGVSMYSILSQVGQDYRVYSQQNLWVQLPRSDEAWIADPTTGEYCNKSALRLSTTMGL